MRLKSLRAEANNSQILDLSNWNPEVTVDRKGFVQKYMNGGANPYCIQCGKVVAEIKYTDDGPSISELLKGILMREEMK